MPIQPPPDKPDRPSPIPPANDGLVPPKIIDRTPKADPRLDKVAKPPRNTLL